MFRLSPAGRLAFHPCQSSGALVGSVAPSDWPGLCQKKAKFKDIPPSLRAFDAQSRNAVELSLSGNPVPQAAALTL